MNEASARGPLSHGLGAAYGTGWIGGQVFRDVPALILLPFMLTVAGVPPAVAGAAIFVPKLWIVFCDPLMGLLSDRTRSRWGRRRPYLFVGAIACGLIFIALFHVPNLASGAAKGAYVGVMYLFASTAFSIYSVPYLTMGSELAATMHERTVVMGWRQAGLGFGLVAGNAMPLWLVEQGGGGADGYGFMALVLAAVCFATMMTTVVGTAGVKLAEQVDAPVPLVDQVRLAARNRPFLILVAANFAQLVGSAGGYATIAMFMTYRLKMDFAFISSFLLVMSSMVVITPALWTMLSRRIGKRAVFIIAICCFIATFGTFGLAAPGDTALIYAIAAGLGAFNCGFSLMAFSMLLDTMAYDRKLSGLNREGVYAGLWSAMDKTAFAFGALLAGLALSFVGYQESAQGFIAQTPEALQGLAIIYVGMPTGFAVLSLVIMLAYGLTERDLAEARPRA
jgi:GPH family glycoside/pentoside/hexuronide:cation symporter